MSAPTTTHSTPATRIVHVAAGGASLTGELTLPADALGVIVFCHTNAAGHANGGDRRVAETLQESGFGTLLFDLLTPDEEMIDAATHGLRNDLSLLARRSIHAIDWLAEQAGTEALPIALYGEGAGAAAALVAACVRPERVSAVVSQTGRPDLASPVLARVRAPTLLIAGGNDDDAIRGNQSAFRRLRCPKELVLVDGGTQPFNDTGSLDEVARLALGWFTRHVSANLPSPRAGEEFC